MNILPILKKARNDLKITEPLESYHTLEFSIQLVLDRCGQEAAEAADKLCPSRNIYWVGYFTEQLNNRVKRFNNTGEY